MLLQKASDRTNSSGSIAKYFNSLIDRKRKLVKLELDLIDRVVADWQTILGNTRTDRAKAESSIKDCYRYAGLEMPTIMWAEHPLNVVNISLDCPDLVDVSGVIINEIWQSESTIQQSIAPESTAHIFAKIDPQHIIKTRSGIRQIEQLNDASDTNVCERLNQLVMSRIRELYAHVPTRTMPTPLQDYRIGELGYFDYFCRIGVDIPQIQPAIELAKSCGWCWTFDRLVILTPKPTKVKIDRHGKIVSIIYNNVNILSDSNQRSLAAT
jgi:hypothetical protein